MIGHYLLTLTPEQEDRVLTTAMNPGGYFRTDKEEFVGGGPCLIGTACGEDYEQVVAYRRRSMTVRMALGKPGDWPTGIEPRYDHLCDRFGVKRVNAAIRSRILANQARRALQREAVAV